MSRWSLQVRLIDFNQRDYGTAEWEGGDQDCDHQVGRFLYPVSEKQKSNSGSAGHQAKHVCPTCGARRLDKQLGQEDLHDCAGWATGDFCGECYICHTLQWGSEVWRVLKNDGIFWLNLGDKYNGSGGAGGDYNKGGLKEGQPRYGRLDVPSLKKKELCGIPWRAALALQAAGWYLRRDVVWHKPNAMVEGGARDRPSTDHEYVFILTKKKNYYWDSGAAKESGANGEPRNVRSVWTMPTSQYRGAHYATWPPALVERMVLYSTAPGDLVLDPFMGSGTTGEVAAKLGRRFVGIDLNQHYIDLARQRTASVQMEIVCQEDR